MCCAVQEGEIVCHISPNYLTKEMLVHRAFQEINKPQNGSGDPELESNTKQCAIKFLKCVEQLWSTTEFRAERVGAGWANGRLHGGGAELSLADSECGMRVESGLLGACRWFFSWNPESPAVGNKVLLRVQQVICILYYHQLEEAKPFTCYSCFCYDLQQRTFSYHLLLEALSCSGMN